MKIRTLAFALLMIIHYPAFATAQEIFVNGEWIKREIFFEMICINEDAFKKKLESLQYYIVDETSLKEMRYNLKVFLRNPQTQGELLPRLLLKDICELVFQLQELNLSCYAINETKPVDLTVASSYCAGEGS
jgi:hypothetical protein